MKKFFTFLASTLLLCGSASATTFNFTSDESVSQTADGYTVKIDKGSGNNAPKYYDNGLRLYAQNTITVSGEDLTRISITFSMQGSKEYASLTASAGSLVSGGTSTSANEKVTDIWTGSASSVTFTLGSTGQRLIYSLVVNGTPGEEETPSNPGGGDDTPGTGGDSSELNPDFQYPEPTLVGNPGITVQGDAYSFVESNVLVACTKGAVTADYFSAHAGFDLTFTATRPIKGIVINGMVKKDFEATATSGSLSYLTPDEDTTADPVLVLTDVNAKSVTISCVKQLRCYGVEIYFDSNPEATVGGGGTPGTGESVNLTFDSAEAVYESEMVEWYGWPNYSVFLFNAAQPDIPYFGLDLYPDTEDLTPGVYTWDDYSLGDYTYYVYGYGDDDYTWAEGGSVTLAKSGNIWTITGTIPCDNGNTYNISFKGEMPVYLDKDYYDDGDDDTAVGTVEADNVPDSPAYDMLGRKVGKNYRGIVIRGGKKVINL